MKDKSYDYILFDAQYFLVRNFKALKSRSSISWVETVTVNDKTYHEVINKYMFTVDDLVTQFFWTIVKLVRDSYSCHKILLAWDCPPYHKVQFLDDFKGSRTYHSLEELETWDIDEDPNAYLQELEEIRIEKVRSEAKKWIINNLGDAGMPSLIHKGYEADDLAVLFSTLPSILSRDSKSAICSADSDWMYWISGKVDFISFNKKEHWTYEDMILEESRLSEKYNMSIFELKTYIDSLFGSHNDLVKSTDLTKRSLDSILEKIQNNEYDFLTDEDRFNRNMQSFKIDEYPEVDQVRDELTKALTGGSFKLSYDDLVGKGFKVTSKYFSNYLSLLTEEYYESSNNL